MGVEDFGGSDLPPFSMSKSTWHTKRQTDSRMWYGGRDIGLGAWMCGPSLGSAAYLGTGFSSV